MQILSTAERIVDNDSFSFYVMARKNIIPVFVPHMGCPYKCVFCNQRRISGRGTPAGPQDIVSALENGLPLCSGSPQLAYYGGSFTALPLQEQQRLLAPAQPYLRDGRLESLRVSTRPDAIDRERLALLREYGVKTVELGAQSMDDGVLSLCGRGHTAADTEAAAAMVKAQGFTLILQMMTGLPGSSREKDLTTAKRLASLGPAGMRIYPTVVLRDTPLYKLWQAGSYQEHTVSDAVEVCADILETLEEADVPVLRLGLNPTDSLSAGEAVAGAYHPALGELVKSRLWLRRVRAALAGCPSGQALTLTVGRGYTSQVIGQRKCNLEALRREFGFASVQVREGDLPYRVLQIEKCQDGSGCAQLHLL